MFRKMITRQTLQIKIYDAILIEYENDIQNIILQGLIRKTSNIMYNSTQISKGDFLPIEIYGKSPENKFIRNFD